MSDTPKCDAALARLTEDRIVWLSKVVRDSGNKRPLVKSQCIELVEEIERLSALRAAGSRDDPPKPAHMCHLTGFGGHDICPGCKADDTRQPEDAVGMGLAKRWLIPRDMREQFALEVTEALAAAASQARAEEQGKAFRSDVLPSMLCYWEGRLVTRDQFAEHVASQARREALDDVIRYYATGSHDDPCPWCGAVVRDASEYPCCNGVSRMDACGWGDSSPSEVASQARQEANGDAYYLAKFITGWWPGLEDALDWGTDLTQHPVLIAAQRIVAARASSPDTAREP